MHGRGELERDSLEVAQGAAQQAAGHRMMYFAVSVLPLPLSPLMTHLFAPAGQRRVKPAGCLSCPRPHEWCGLETNAAQAVRAADFLRFRAKCRPHCGGGGKAEGGSREEYV
jgi:hypothetical protein